MLIVELILNDIYIVFFVDGKWGEGVVIFEWRIFVDKYFYFLFYFSLK